jgi:hypothetical protein
MPVRRAEQRYAALGISREDRRARATAVANRPRIGRAPLTETVRFLE